MNKIKINTEVILSYNKKTRYKYVKINSSTVVTVGVFYFLYICKYFVTILRIFVGVKI